MQILWLLRAMIFAALLSLALTPLDFRVAARLGAIDVPRDTRRMHKKPVPRLGGLSIFFSFLLLTLIYDFKIASDLFYAWSGAILIVLIGVLDDELSLPPVMKFAVQLAAAYVSTIGGAVLRTLRIGNTTLSLGVLSLPLTLLFLVTMINAHNFIDGLDGLCAGVSLCESLALGLMSLAVSPEYAAASFLLGGACIGFLPYNIRGARLFMGDTGSTFLGFMLAAIAIRTQNSPLAFLLLFALPLADLFFAVTRRLLSGKNPLLPDRSHLHHLLADRVGAYRASRLLCFAAALTALFAVLLAT
ncbi:MAG: undecaprenyl/decaprenyl-phosphate alpha-N-acetylglucosaminyl 1-phosphate transferase [Clostridia bacterium]|nr:undecaprenyl/decaprenyl-phosphate alpha-N-acetylglucosaminyl 1-phosphate transferase [Clostridia bacterium]